MLQMDGILCYCDFEGSPSDAFYLQNKGTRTPPNRLWHWPPPSLFFELYDSCLKTMSRVLESYCVFYKIFVQLDEFINCQCGKL